MQDGRLNDDGMVQKMGGMWLSEWGSGRVERCNDAIFFSEKISLPDLKL